MYSNGGRLSDVSFPQSVNPSSSKNCDLTTFLSVSVNRKLQIKPRKFEEYVDENGETKERCTEVQLILKWGGSK